MQRVLSGERARCTESSEEFVTKKLCVSFMIVCAFFSILGGFFLGRYALEKMMASPKRTEHCPAEVLNQLSASLNRLNNLTAVLSAGQSFLATVNSSELSEKLRCSGQKDFNLTALESDLNSAPWEAVSPQLELLGRCYNDVVSFLESVLVPD